MYRFIQVHVYPSKTTLRCQLRFSRCAKAPRGGLSGRLSDIVHTQFSRFLPPLGNAQSLLVERFLRLQDRLRIGQLSAGSMLDLKDAVDFIERKAGGFNVEDPDKGYPDEVQNSEDDVEAPLDVLDPCLNQRSKPYAMS